MWDGFGWVAPGKFEDKQVVVVEVRCGYPLHVFVGVAFPSNEVV